MGRILRRASLRYLGRHPWQFGLSILGVALGVAVTVSVDLANGAASRAFEVATEAVTGRATHQISAGSRGLEEVLYRRLRIEHGVRTMAPVVEAWVTARGDSSRSYRLLGIDPLAEGPVRPAFRAVLGEEGVGIDLASLMTTPGAVVLSRRTADGLGVARGDRLELSYEGSAIELTVVGVLEPAGGVQRAGLQDVLVTDIATAQEATDRLGRLDRIDLVLQGAEVERVAALLPETVAFRTAAARSDATLEMTRAFRLNLLGMSLLALVCGAFLIYNTVTFSVVQRRGLIGALRALGVTRREVFGLVIGEALAVGLAGTVLGLAAGVLLARSLVHLVTRTINDLYFVVSVRGVQIAPESLLVGAALGLGATLLAAVPPALEATRATPRSALTRSMIETRTVELLPRLAGAGSLMFLLGTAAILAPGGGLLLAFAGLFVALLGAALVVPLLTYRLALVLAVPARRIAGTLGALAVRGVSASLSRTAVAVAALMIAVSVIVGVGVMVGSFRTTLVRWLDHTLAADLYVSPAGGRGASELRLGPGRLQQLAREPGVSRIQTIRRVELETASEPITLLVLGGELRDASAYRFLDVDGETAWEALRAGAVWVSEPYAERHAVRIGDRVVLPTDAGIREYPVGGTYYSYASDRGAVLMARDTYDASWDDVGVSGVAVYADAETDLAELARRVRGVVASGQAVSVVTNRELREQSLVVFDRTFLITDVLRLLVMAVAFVGVLSALMAQQLERAREFAVLRAGGLTPRQLRVLVTAQTGVLGMIAGALAVPLGLFLAWVMIDVINKRSFGWSLQMTVPPGILLQAVGVAVLAGLLAGVLPARRMAATPPAVALREE